MSWMTLTCARCGKERRKEVIYGYPVPAPLPLPIEDFKVVYEPDVVFGGCSAGGPPPAWLCDPCEEFFGDDLAARRRCMDEARRRRLIWDENRDKPDGGTP